MRTEVFRDVLIDATVADANNVCAVWIWLALVVQLTLVACMLGAKDFPTPGQDN